MVTSRDPITVAALVDPDLQLVLTVFPVDVRLDVIGDPSSEDQARRQAANQLGSDLTLPAAIALLDAVGIPPPSLRQDYLDTFSAAVAAQVSDPTPLLERLKKGRLLGGELLLCRIANHHPDAIHSWLAHHLEDSVIIAELAVAVADSLPTDTEKAMLDQIHTTYFATTSTRPDEYLPSHPEHRHTLAQALAWHLATCRRAPNERLHRLQALGEAASTGELEWVLYALKVVLKDPPQAALLLRTDPDLQAALFRVLARALAVNDDFNGTLTYATAEVVSALGPMVPTDMAMQFQNLGNETD